MEIKHPKQHYLKRHPREFDLNMQKSTSQPDKASFFQNNHVQEISMKDRMATAMCIGKHVLPFSFVDDPVIQWTFDVKISAGTFKTAVEALHYRVSASVSEDFRTKKGTIAIDDWTNPLTKDKPICIVAQPVSMTRKIYFVSSTYMRGILDSEALLHFLVEAITELQSKGFTTIGVVGDNARAQQSAMSSYLIH